MIIKNSKKEILNKKHELHCRLSNTIRLVLPVFDSGCIYVYPCCVYQWSYMKNPIGKIYFDELKNINLYDRLNEIWQNKIYKNVYASCFSNNDISPNNINIDNYTCDWASKDKFKNITVSFQKTCNLKCNVCRKDYIKNTEIDEYYFNVLETLKGHGIKTLQLTQDGEPFFYKSRILSYLNSLTYNDFSDVFIISNLTLLNDDDIELLKEIKNNKIWIQIVASIDGMTPDTYKKIRGVNTFEKVMHNANLLNKYGLLSGVNYILSEDTINELPEAYEYWVNVSKTELHVLPLNQNTENAEYEKIINTPAYKNYLMLREKH